MAATALLVEEAQKLTLGQQLIVKVPYGVQEIMEIKEAFWMTKDHQAKCRPLLFDSPVVQLEVCNTLNPAIILPQINTDLHHDCV